ncbi:MAG: AMP-binding protein [Tepidisphaeraceae bacterium]
MRVVDDTNTSLKPGDVGEVLLGGPMIMQGYHNLPDASREVLNGAHEFRTGDLGKLDDDGFLFITGRAKDMIIIAGEKLFPREIEEILLAHPTVADSAVIGKKDDSRGEVVVAFVTPREGQTIEIEKLKTHLKDSGLPNWKMPREIVVLPELPRSPTGKVLKRELASKAS